MLPNTRIPVADAANPFLQPNPPLWITDCLSISASNHPVWTSDWVKSLQTGLGGANSPTTIVEGYQQLTEQLNSLLQQPYATDKDAQHDGVSALLRQLLVMHVYLETAAAYYPNKFVKLQTNQWAEQATRVMMTVPKEVYLKQLDLLVKEAIDKKCEKQPIDRTVDRALLKLQQRTLTLYFQQLLDGLRNTTQDGSPPDEEESVCKPYIHMIGILHTYTRKLSTLPLTETEHLPKLLLDQLTQIIKLTSTQDLSPSWMERLKQWIELCFKKLQSWYMETPSTAKPSYSPLRVISQQLLKSTRKVVRKKRWCSPQLIRVIREHRWLYFSLHEQLISQWWDKEKHALEYQSTALALFESFMSTFDWSTTFKKGILHENPLKSHRSAPFNRNQATPVEHWEEDPLLDTALNKLCTDFFLRDWSCWLGYSHPENESFLHWLLSRQERRLIAKIKVYISTEEREFQKDKIPFFDQRNLCRLVQAVHKDFCADLNQITQMILSVWFQEIGIMLPHADLAPILLKPGRWLYHPNQQVPETGWEAKIPFFAFLMLEAIERLGTGVYFFPPLQQRWSAFQEALAVHSGKAAEFVRQHHTEIAAILKRLLLIFHVDHKSEDDRNDALFKEWAQRYLPQIQSVKQDLQKFRERNPNELQSLNAERAANSLLMCLKDVVLNCMHCHVRVGQWSIHMLSLSPDELHAYSQKTRQYISELKQIDADMAKARKAEKEADARLEAAEAREEAAKAREEAAKARLEEVLAELERLKALLAQQERQTPPQVSLTASRVTLFPASAASPSTSATAACGAASPSPSLTK